MISTCRGDEMRKVKTKREEEKEKPVSFLDYNPNMIGVDLKDQLLASCHSTNCITVINHLIDIM
jgi:hypothetical protein